MCHSLCAKCFSLSQSVPIEPIADHSTSFSDANAVYHFLWSAGINKVTGGQDHDPLTDKSARMAAPQTGEIIYMTRAWEIRSEKSHLDDVEK
jgi:hypothetical protein